jgi:O-antigen ligase
MPVLAFIGVGAITLPFVMNNGLAREWLQQQLLYWLLMVATIGLVDSARRVEWLFLTYALSFAWWGFWGAQAGKVGWHHVLSNEDGYGALMAIGLGFCSFLVVAVQTKWLRVLMLISAALCVVGVVASFARGAFLASVAVFAMVWIRSPRKGLTLGAGVGAALVVVGAAMVLHGDAYTAEIQSVFHEGTEQGTGNDRWVLWMAAWEVFLHNPIFGAGPNNWGVFATTIFDFGELGSMYANNPGRLYTRSLHSLYFTIISELGIAGVIAFLWILVDFWRRNAALRTQAAAQRWREIGGTYQLRALALGLEVAMVGFLAIAGVYSTAGKHWLFTILALNLVLHAHTVRGQPKTVGNGAGRARGLRGLRGRAPGRVSASSPATVPGAARVVNTTAHTRRSSPRS